MGLKRLASLMEAEHVASWTRCARQVAALVGAAGPDMTCWQEPIHHHANKPYRFAAAKMHAQVGMNAPDIAGDKPGRRWQLSCHLMLQEAIGAKLLSIRSGENGHITLAKACNKRHISISSSTRNERATAGVWVNVAPNFNQDHHDWPVLRQCLKHALMSYSRLPAKCHSKSQSKLQPTPTHEDRAVEQSRERKSCGQNTPHAGRATIHAVPPAFDVDGSGRQHGGQGQGRGCPATTEKEKTHMWRRDARARWVLELWRWRAQGGVAVYMRNFEVYEEFVAAPRLSSLCDFGWGLRGFVSCLPPSSCRPCNIGCSFRASLPSDFSEGPDCFCSRTVSVCCHPRTGLCYPLQSLGVASLFCSWVSSCPLPSSPLTRIGHPLSPSLPEVFARGSHRLAFAAPSNLLSASAILSLPCPGGSREHFLLQVRIAGWLRCVLFFQCLAERLEVCAWWQLKYFQSCFF